MIILKNCLNNLEKCKIIGANAQRYINNNYSENIIIEQIEKYLSS